MPPTPCPSIAELRDLLLGRLSDAKAELLTAHVDRCQKCQDRADDLSLSDDSLFGLLKDVPESLKQNELDPKMLQRLDQIVKGPESTSFPKDLQNYRLQKQIGSGGMGTVYLATHLSLSKPVAVKLLRSDREHDTQFISRFQREMKALGALKHPAIAEATDGGFVGNVHYLVLEYVDGVDLSKVIQHNLPISLADAAQIIRTAALGLQHAHQRGLVHRDIKPSNIMISTDGQVKLLDFGLASVERSLVDSDTITVHGQQMGTLAYMSPEQWLDSRTADARSDIYGLGVTLLELLGGRQVVREILGGAMAHKLVDKIRPLPARLRTLLKSMLEADPDRRLSDPGVVAQELLGFTLSSDLKAVCAQTRQATGAENQSQAKTPQRPTLKSGPLLLEERARKHQVIRRAVIGTLAVTVCVLGTLVYVWPRTNPNVSGTESQPPSSESEPNDNESTTQKLGNETLPSQPISSGPAASPGKVKLASTPSPPTVLQGSIIDLGTKTTKPVVIQIQVIESQDTGQSSPAILISIQSGDDTETSYLHLDWQEYEKTGDIRVIDGYTVLPTPHHQFELAEQVGSQLALAYTNDSDAVQTFADSWHYQLPPHRVSTQNVLDFIRGVDPATSTPQNPTETEQVSETTEPPVSNSIAYDIKTTGDELEGSSNLQQVTMNWPDRSLRLERATATSENTSLVAYSSEELEQLAEKVRAASLPSFETFSVANLPETAGAYAKYSGEYQRSKTSSNFDVELLTGEQVEVNGVNHRWLRISILETAVSWMPSPLKRDYYLLVNEPAFHNENLFQFDRGWVIQGDDVVRLSMDDMEGNNARRLLYPNSVKKEIGLEEVLNLIFDARIIPSPTATLRPSIAASLTKADQDRNYLTEEFQIGAAEKVWGRSWNLHIDDRLAYTIKRSPKLPYGFGVVLINLQAGGETLLHLSARLESNDSAHESAQLDETPLEERYQSTLERATLHTVARVWKDTAGKILTLGEYEGYFLEGDTPTVLVSSYTGMLAHPYQHPLSFPLEQLGDTEFQAVFAESSRRILLEDEARQALLIGKTRDDDTRKFTFHFLLSDRSPLDVHQQELRSYSPLDAWETDHQTARERLTELRREKWDISLAATKGLMKPATTPRKPDEAKPVAGARGDGGSGSPASLLLVPILIKEIIEAGLR